MESKVEKSKIDDEVTKTLKDAENETQSPEKIARFTNSPDFNATEGAKHLLAPTSDRIRDPEAELEKLEQEKEWKSNDVECEFQEEEGGGMNNTMKSKLSRYNTIFERLNSGRLADPQSKREFENTNTSLFSPPKSSTEKLNKQQTLFPIQQLSSQGDQSVEDS